MTGHDIAQVTKRRAGRPRSFDRDAAVATALDLFWRHGFDAVGVETLTEAMGIRPSSFYVAFGSKNGLLAEVADRYEATAGEAVGQIVQSAPTARDGFAQLFAHFAQVYAPADGPAGCFLNAQANAIDDPAARAALAARRARVQEMFEARILRAIAEEGLDPATDAAGLAAFIVAVGQGMTIQARDGADPAALDAIGRHAMAALGPALTPPPRA